VDKLPKLVEALVKTADSTTSNIKEKQTTLASSPRQLACSRRPRSRLLVEAVLITVAIVCATVLVLAFFKRDVSETLKCFGIGHSLEARDRTRK
jgi:hypothetical protein